MLQNIRKYKPKPKPKPKSPVVTKYQFIVTREGALPFIESGNPFPFNTIKLSTPVNTLFNTTTHEFITPVTGVYVLSYSLTFRNIHTTHTSLYIKINKNHNVTEDEFVHSFNANAFKTSADESVISNTIMLQLTALDNIRIIVQYDDATEKLQAHHIGSRFSGYLL